MLLDKYNVGGKMKHRLLNKDQVMWLEEIMQDTDIIFASIHGSWLYGLQREGSDIDIKAIYAPSKNAILLGDSCKTYNKKNDELNIEIEVKSLHSFLKSASSVDTNCVDLLYTPDNFILKTTPIWEDIRSHRSCMLSKNMKGLLGYIKVHSNKYGNKITRFKEMNKLLVELQYLNGNCRLENTTIPEWVDRQGFKYIKTILVKSDHEQNYIDVCGKKYILTWESRLLEGALETEIKKFGDRTKKGNETGMDFKALSHAIRVLCQLEELLLTGDLKFPLADSDYILRVNTGQVTDNKYIMDSITEHA